MNRTETINWYKKEIEYFKKELQESNLATNSRLILEAAFKTYEKELKQFIEKR